MVAEFSSPIVEDRRGVRSRAYRTGNVRMVGQPILRLNDLTTMGVEALARFASPLDMAPDEIFRQAALEGDGCRLEATAIKLAMKALPQMPEREFLAVNASPEGCASNAVQGLLSREADRIVLEITERSQIDSYVFLNRALLRLRADGMRLAIDDVGSGFANWGHIVHLQPDIIKLDGHLVVDIEADNLRRAVVKGVVRMAEDLGSNVVAEQVETRKQADCLTDLGVEWAQGYYFAHPTPLCN